MRHSLSRAVEPDAPFHTQLGTMRVWDRLRPTMFAETESLGCNCDICDIGMVRCACLSLCRQSSKCAFASVCL